MTKIDNDQQTISYFKQFLSNLDTYHQSEYSNLVMLHRDITQNLGTIQLNTKTIDTTAPAVQLHAIYQGFASIAQLGQTLVSTEATARLNAVNHSNKAILLQMASQDSAAIVEILAQVKQIAACQLKDISILQKLRLNYNKKTLIPDSEYLHFLVNMLPKHSVKPSFSDDIKDLVSLTDNVLTLNLETPLASIQNITNHYERYLQRLTEELIDFPQHEKTTTTLLHHKKLTEVLAFPNTPAAIVIAMNRPKRLLVVDYAITNNLKQLHDIGKIALDQTSIEYLKTINSYYQKIQKTPYQHANITVVDYLDQLVKQSINTLFRQKIHGLQIAIQGWKKLKEYAQYLFFAPQFNQQLKYFGIT